MSALQPGPDSDFPGLLSQHEDASLTRGTACALFLPTPPTLQEMDVERRDMEIFRKTVLTGMRLWEDRAQLLCKPCKTRKESSPVGSGGRERAFLSRDNENLQQFPGRTPTARGSRKVARRNVLPRRCVAAWGAQPGLWILTPWSYPEPQKGINLWPLAHQHREVRREARCCSE